MRPYGMPRHHNTDDRSFYNASALYHVPGPGGDARAILKPARKARARRLLKRAARRQGRQLIADAQRDGLAALSDSMPEHHWYVAL